MIILLSGHARAGKDTVADILEKNYGAQVFAFADSIKDIARKMGWDGKKDERGRKLLQTLGTEVGRAYNENVWVNMCIAEMKQMQVLHNFTGFPKLFVVSDCRFPNEIERVKQEFSNVFAVRIHRNTEEHMSHSSETALDDYEFDEEIFNNGSLESLRDTVVDMVERRGLLNKVTGKFVL